MSETFWPDDVNSIIDAEKIYGINALEENGVRGLKERVTDAVRSVTGITGKMPDRIRTWIHQLCMQITANIDPEFIRDPKLSQAIDLKSLPPQQRPNVKSA